MPIKQLGLSWPALGAATVLALLALRRALKRRPRAPAGAIVVVTGCDTGIGNATAKLLSEQTRNGEPEFRVLAGCLTPQGIDELKALGRQNLVPFELDVTSDESVERMRKMVGEECSGKGLFALYNIAGIGLGTTVDLTPMEEQKMVMEVNYFGVVRCTAALLPWIHQAAHFSRLANARGEPTLKPKVITISSVLSVITLPGASAYVASKHAVQGFVNCLRSELRPWSIDVVEVRPFWVATNIVPTPEKVDQWKDSVVARYGLPAPGDVDRDPFGMENPLNKYVGGLDALYEQRIAGTKNLPAGGNMMTPRHVGELMLNQMRAEKPKDHIVVSDGLGSTLFYSIFRHLPTLAGVLVGRGYERSMKAFVRPIKVQEKEAAQRTVVAERELVAA